MVLPALCAAGAPTPGGGPAWTPRLGDAPLAAPRRRRGSGGGRPPAARARGRRHAAVCPRRACGGHARQLAARLDQLAAEVVDLARLLRRDDRLAAGFLAGAAQVGELLLGVLDLVLELLLLGAELAFGILLDRAHQGERPIRDAARAQAD